MAKRSKPIGQQRQDQRHRQREKLLDSRGSEPTVVNMDVFKDNTYTKNSSTSSPGIPASAAVPVEKTTSYNLFTLERIGIIVTIAAAIIGLIYWFASLRKDVDYLKDDIKETKTSVENLDDKVNKLFFSFSKDESSFRGKTHK